MPLNGFTAVDLGYQRGDAVSSFVNRFDESVHTGTYLQLFNQIWADPTKLEDVTATICEHIESVYQENSPERIYFLMLYNIFNEFLEDIDEDVLPNDRTGYQDSLIWNKLFNFQRDAATGIINKLETYNGCILADSVGLGKTFMLAAVNNIKPDRTNEDLLFQVLVDWGVDLTLPILRKTFQDKTIFCVDQNSLVACFDNGITEEFVKDIAILEPLRVVFRDNGFVSDAVKINVEQIFRQLSPKTDIKSI